MNQPPPNILSHEWGWDNIRRDVFQLVAWGYRCKEKEIRQRRLEEKRCARKKYKGKYKIDWYAQGISAFLNGLYAKDSPEGGLLGLMQSDDAKYWKNELSRKLKDDASLCCQSPLSEAESTPDLP